MYKLSQENKTEIFLGFGLLFTLILASYFTLENKIFYRFLIGLGFGYALVKASLGFAGSVNKLTRMGSASVAKALMLNVYADSAFTQCILSCITMNPSMYIKA